MTHDEEQSSLENKAIANRIHEMLDRHGVGKRQHAIEVQRILGLSYSQAHRKMKGANPWTIAQVKAVAEEFGEPAAALLEGIESSGLGEEGAESREALIQVGLRTYACVAEIGALLPDLHESEFVATQVDGRWNVYAADEAPLGERFIVHQIVIRPQPAIAYKPRIAVIDDDISTTTELCAYLNRHGYATNSYNSEHAFRAALDGRSFDGFIIDWLLSDTTAERAIRLIRQSRNSGAPIFLLTGKLATGEASEDDVARVIEQFDVKAFEKPARLNWITAELGRRVQERRVRD